MMSQLKRFSARGLIALLATICLWGVASAQTSPNASQNTGYVVPAPTIYLVYWHDDWNKNNPVKRGQIKTFVKSLVSNGYFNWASQYRVSGVTFGDAYKTGVLTVPCGPRRAPSTVS